MNKWKAIVFDLDDTLYPERDYVFSGFRCVAAWAETHCNIPAMEGYQHLTSLYESGVRGDTFNRWLQSYQRSLHFVPELVETYRRHTPTLELFPAMGPLLANLHKLFRLGLVSDGYWDVQKRKFAALKISNYFDAVVFSDEWGREAWKPSPFPFLTIVERLGLPAHEIVYVADNPTKDFYGARQIGMATIWCRHSNGDYVHLEPPSASYAADLTVDSVDSLYEIFVPDSDIDSIQRDPGNGCPGPHWQDENRSRAEK
jgi:putative hydrolase of the HAD superfamily